VVRNGRCRGVAPVSVAVLPVAVVEAPLPVAPWRQQPDEPLEAFQAFCVWSLVDPPLPLTGELAGTADRWRWPLRKHHLEQQLRDRVSPAEAMRDAMANAMYVLCAKWRELAAQVGRGTDGMKPRDTLQLLQMLMQPAAAAFAAERAQAPAEGDGGFLDMSLLTADECATFAELHAKCWRRRDG
jgi:hypothetical protein